jgi:hypothetical protein
MTVGGQTYRQSFEVKMDPRVKYVRSELQSALSLELKISEVLGRNLAAYQQVKDLRLHLAEFGSGKDAAAVAASQLAAKAAALQGDSVTIFDVPKNSFITVNDSLVSLIALVDSADFAPSDESFAALERVCAAMNDAIQQWQQLKEKDLAVFNQTLDPQKRKAIPDYPAIGAATNCAR